MKLFALILLFSKLAVAAETTEVLILGDSLTEGYGVSPQSAYPALVQKELEAQGKKDVKVINAGVSGSTSASGPSRIKWHLKAKPEIVIIALGANDGLRGLQTNEMRKNLSQTVELAKKAGSKVILAGMKIPMNYGTEYRKSFEKTFEELSKEYQIPLIPFLLEGVGGDSSLNQPDGIHPNEKGHQMIAKTVLKYLKPLL